MLKIFQSKPEFVSVLADKQVKTGEDVTLRCKMNTERLTVSWEKTNQKLRCVEGKHRTGKIGTIFFLEIKNAEMDDEGKYTVTIQNSWGSISSSAMVLVELDEWRTIRWQQDPMIKALEDFKISSEGSEVRELRFLLYGPIGAGKSSIINTINTVFERHHYINCLAASALTGDSFTKKFEKFSIKNFAFYDVMGLEEGEYNGVQTNDIINAVKGHIPDDYKFKENAPIDEENTNYIKNPTLNDQIHCLVSVIPADKISLIDDKLIQKMKKIRAEASESGIPQVVLMTRVDEVCQITQRDVAKIYRSRKIKEKMMECSNRLGLPLNYIFPVKNYNVENNPNENLNCLMLEALTQTVNAANAYVKKESKKTSSKQKKTE